MDIPQTGVLGNDTISIPGVAMRKTVTSQPAQPRTIVDTFAQKEVIEDSTMVDMNAAYSTSTIAHADEPPPVVVVTANLAHPDAVNDSAMSDDVVTTNITTSASTMHATDVKDVLQRDGMKDTAMSASDTVSVSISSAQTVMAAPQATLSATASFMNPAT